MSGAIASHYQHLRATSGVEYVMQPALSLQRREGSISFCSPEENMNMNISAPKQLTFWIAVAVAVVGVILKLIPSLSALGFSGWLILIAFVILAAGCLVEGL